MNERYWQAIVRYGHLGKGREVSVARFIITKSNENILDAFIILESMSGTKTRAVQHIFEINSETYLRGKSSEKENFYFKNLMTYKKTREKSPAA